MGEIATAGGFFTYHIIMTCYGFPFDIYYQLLGQPAYIPSAGVKYNEYLGDPATTYDPASPNLGYPNYLVGPCNSIPSQISNGENYPDWLSLNNNQVDLRAVYVKCCRNNLTNFCSQFLGKWPPYSSVLHTVSPISGRELAYTTETIFYAQSGYFATVAWIQWSNVFACKSRKVLLSL
jgi:sodium/potassium-transporting ATPase subunit alpha